MKTKRKMVVVNVEIRVGDPDTMQCGDDCRFLDEMEQMDRWKCILFSKRLRTTELGLLRCRPCLSVEPA